MRNIHDCYILVTLDKLERADVHGKKECFNFNVFYL